MSKIRNNIYYRTEAFATTFIAAVAEMGRAYCGPELLTGEFGRSVIAPTEVGAPAKLAARFSLSAKGALL